VGSVRATLWVHYRDGGRALVPIRDTPLRIYYLWRRLGTVTHWAGRPVKRCVLHLVPPPFGDVLATLLGFAVMAGLGAWMAIKGLG
jgi:hypothetical protein